MKKILAQYGKVALAVYLAIFVVVLGGFVIAIAAGVRPRGVAGGAGMLGAAWVATKLTQPLRIGATLLLTPIVARAAAKLRRKRGGEV